MLKKNIYLYMYCEKCVLILGYYYYLEYPLDYYYLEYPLSRTFTISNVLFVPFSILINLPYKSDRYLRLCYLELSQCRIIFTVPSVIFGLFPFRYSNIRMRFSNESSCSFQAFEC